MSKQARVAALLARPIKWPCPIKAVEHVALEEDCRLKAYRDIGGKPTCGWGETDGVVMGMVWTQDYADQRLLQALEVWTARVLKYLGDAPTSENELCAMLVLSYNIGLEAFRTSTVLRLHKKGDRAGAARAFALFNKVRKNGVLVEEDALVARRMRESALYLTPDDSDVADSCAGRVQTVEPESKLSKSPITASGVASMGVGALGMLKAGLDQAREYASGAAEVATTLQVSPIVVLALIAIAVGATSVYWRWRQREGGWA